MKPFMNELFSIQIDPAKGSEGNCQLYSLYNDGTFTVIQSAPFSMDEKNSMAECFQATDPHDVASLQAFAKEQTALFKDCPAMIALPDFRGSSFTLSIGGVLCFGSYNKVDLSKLRPDVASDKDLVKKLEWNNRVVALLEGFMALARGIAPATMAYKPNARVLDYLRPVPRFLFSLLANDEKVKLPLPGSKDEAIKLAAKEAFKESTLPTGAVYNACFVSLKRGALPLLEEAKTRADFDKAHAKLTHELMDDAAGDFSFAQAAYWLDLTYAYLLVMVEPILYESKVALLHAPVSPKELREDSKAEDETSYLFFQNDGRKEWDLLHISPVYFYLESVYSNAHPLEGKKQDNQA
jgi:hypothetical protein